MKIVEKYKCEICDYEYDSEAEALKCESRGIEKPLCNKGRQVKYYMRMGGGYSHWIEGAYVSKVYQEGHYCKYVIKGFDWGGKKYVLNDSIYCNSNFMKLCKFQ